MVDQIGAQRFKEKNQSFESHQEIQVGKARAFTYQDLGEQSKIINWNQFAHIVCTLFRSHKSLHISKSIHSLQALRLIIPCISEKTIEHFYALTIHIRIKAFSRRID